MSALYEMVTQYADFGDHRTGTPVDRATTDWLARRLSALGADVQRQAYAFPMFSGQATGGGAGAGIRLEPLYYSAAGDCADEAAFVASIDFDADHSDHAIGRRLDEIARQAKSAGAQCAVVATGSAQGGLCAINRAPRAPGDTPICLAAGRDRAQLLSGPVGVRFEAHIAEGRSQNLSAAFPGPEGRGPSLVLTTPLSGWFSCAGERGTGLAIALSVAWALSQHVPVLMVIPTGHELGYLGAANYLAAFDEPVLGVLHLGSCLADKTALAGDGAMRAVSNLEGARFQQLSDAVEPLALTPEQPCVPTDPEEWIGESELWAPRGFPMISIAGTSETFHTPEDLAPTATSPELLERAASCVLKAAQALICQSE